MHMYMYFHTVGIYGVWHCVGIYERTLNSLVCLQRGLEVRAKVALTFEGAHVQTTRRES